MRRLSSEDGFVLPAVISILGLVLLLTGVIVTRSLHSVDRSNRDRDWTRALQAAEAGADVAQWRLNKTLGASGRAGLLGTGAELLEQAARNCIVVTLREEDGREVLSTAPGGGGGWCPNVEGEFVDGSVGADGTGEPAGYSYRVQLDVDVGTDSPLMARDIISWGVSGDVRRRVKVELDAALDPGNGTMTSLFDRVSFVECSPGDPDQSDPLEGC